MPTQSQNALKSYNNVAKILARRSMTQLRWLNLNRGESARQEEYVELKYTYAVVHLFNNDMLSVLVNILLKLCQAYEQPAVQSPILAGPQGSFLLSTIQPALKLIHCLLSQVIINFDYS